MSDTPTGDPGKPMEQPNNDLSEVMGQLPVAADDSDESSPSLSDMPIDVVGVIIERSDYKEQLILRKVSKSLRALVDKHKPSCRSLYVSFSYDPNWITCCYNDKDVNYQQPYCFGKTEFWKKYEATFSDDYEKIAFDDLAFTLRNPKLQLEYVRVDFNHAFDLDEHDFLSRQYMNLCGILESIGHQLSAKRCEVEITVPWRYRSILPYLKPGVLEKITVIYTTEFDSWDEGKSLDTLEQVVLLDQWKQAKELELVNNYGSFPMEYATHFKRFHFNELHADSRQLLRIRDYLSTHRNFEHCLIENSEPFDLSHIHTLLGNPAAPNERTEYVSHYGIPNSDDYLEFMIFDETIEVERKKRSS